MFHGAFFALFGAGGTIKGACARLCSDGTRIYTHIHSTQARKHDGETSPHVPQRPVHSGRTPLAHLGSRGRHADADGVQHEGQYGRLTLLAEVQHQVQRFLQRQ